MIIDNSKLQTSAVMSQVQSPDSPPSYDYATGQSPAGSSSGVAPIIPQPAAKRQSPPRKEIAPVFRGTGFSISQNGTTSASGPTVYHYQHPVTGEVITSLLPPEHPEMVCLQEGRHLAETNYGLLGVLAAIFWFPLGVGLCLLDRRVRCKRCGVHIESGVFG